MPQVLPYQDPRDPAITGRAAAGFGHISLAAMSWDLKEKQERDGFICVKASSTRRVLTFEEDVCAEKPIRLYAKRNLARTGLKALAYRLYGSKARREWSLGWALITHSFITGRPVVFAERRRRGLVVENYLVTEAIAADRPLLDHLRLIIRERNEDPAPLFAPLAGYLRTLHDIGFYHDDLSAEHIWVCLPDSDHRTVAPSHHRTEFGLIDLDQSRFFIGPTESRVMMNLFQVLRSIPKRLLTPAQREAILAAYFLDTWPRRRDEVLATLRRIEQQKGARDTLG